MAYLLVGVNALGRHSKLGPHEAKAVIDAFIKEQEVDMQKQVEVQKEKFKEDIKNGKMPEFTVLPNPDKAE